MPAARKPQDHLAKKTAEEDFLGATTPFEFEHNGETYQLAVADEVLTAGYARKNRHKSLPDQLFSMLELLADKETLEAIDDMGRVEFTAFQEAFYAHIGVDLGE